MQLANYFEIFVNPNSHILIKKTHIIEKNRNLIQISKY